MAESKDNELSLDELKDASGGLKGDEMGHGKLKGDRVSPNQLKGDEMGHGKFAGGLGCNAGGWSLKDKKGQK